MADERGVAWWCYAYWTWLLNQRGRLLAPLIVVCLVFILFAIFEDTKTWLDRISPLLGIAAILQLDSSGWFEGVMEKYQNAATIPSRIARDIVDDPSRPWRTAVRNYVYYDAGAGYWLGIIALLLQVWSSWLQ